MIARDIFQQCYAIYVSTYGFDEKKKLIVEHLRKQPLEDKKNVSIYAGYQQREHEQQHRIAAMIQTLVWESMIEDEAKGANTV